MLRFSDIEKPTPDTGCSLVMVGSFAPIHEGHIDAMLSAKRALNSSGEEVSSTVFVPNSDSYVSVVKLKDNSGRWSFSRRVLDMMSHQPVPDVTTFVDDISGQRPPERSITETALATAQRLLGVEADRLVIVVGSDRVDRMRPHLENNRAICVMRPGSLDDVLRQFDQQWFIEAVASSRYVLTGRENSVFDISSTDIRKKMEDALEERAE